MHACPSCGEEIDPIQSNVMDDMSDFFSNLLGVRGRIQGADGAVGRGQIKQRL